MESSFSNNNKNKKIIIDRVGPRHFHGTVHNNHISMLGDMRINYFDLIKIY